MRWRRMLWSRAIVKRKLAIRKQCPFTIVYNMSSPVRVKRFVVTVHFVCVASRSSASTTTTTSSSSISDRCSGDICHRRHGDLLSSRTQQMHADKGANGLRLCRSVPGGALRRATHAHALLQMRREARRVHRAVAVRTAHALAASQRVDVDAKHIVPRSRLQLTIRRTARRTHFAAPQRSVHFKHSVVRCVVNQIIAHAEQLYVCKCHRLVARTGRSVPLGPTALAVLSPSPSHTLALASGAAANHVHPYHHSLHQWDQSCFNWKTFTARPFASLLSPTSLKSSFSSKRCDLSLSGDVMARTLCRPLSRASRKTISAASRANP
jgi:hypothetical protein